MASWLESYAPRRFDELAMDVTIQKNLEKVALQANPPHIILAGPPGELERPPHGVYWRDKC